MLKARRKTPLLVGPACGMQGKDKETYTGVAKFLDFLAKPENAAEWHQKTGYLPITTAAQPDS